MINVQYSVLCHYPSIVAKDCITLGVLFYNKDEKNCVFEITKAWNRVKSFNDELDIDLVKLQLNDIANEVDGFCKNDEFNLDDYTKFYVNELKFTEVVNIEIDNFSEFVGECKRQYLRFDFNKKDRPTVNEQLSFVKKIMKASDISYKVHPAKGYFDENIKFDFVIDEYAFKLFRFEGRNEMRLINNVKNWAYDAYKLKDEYKVVFVTDVDFSEDNDNYNLLYRILKEESNMIINFNEMVSFIKKIGINNEKILSLN
ncbi:hypothetical protein DP122_05190 [Clostridium tetani]|uniref:DUF3037 domain-containing protein n=1 Tax=Clostridium tetani TaxID=1513 RepID=UPI00100A384A|nr:DUF3037 domain-containing protein [Clostridium tetani]RXI55297.1 hypothetical protein DP122_05190 [Clostridium tetani]RXM75139.1 hypothetical protein DP154_10245 [Clostridium tetani]RYU98482.1 hypothetical protein DP144_10680 [Clostridium tetani]BDR66951.1 hypothetical protein K144312032_11790 [Clostridium tetani]